MGGAQATRVPVGASHGEDPLLPSAERGQLVIFLLNPLEIKRETISSPSSPFSWPQWSSSSQWSGSPRSQRCSLCGEPPTQLEREAVWNNPPWLPRRQWVVINHDHILKVLEKFKSMEIYPPCQIWRKVKMFQSAIFDKHWQVHRLILRFNFHHGLSPPALSPNGWKWLKVLEPFTDTFHMDWNVNFFLFFSFFWGGGLFPPFSTWMRTSKKGRKEVKQINWDVSTPLCWKPARFSWKAFRGLPTEKEESSTVYTRCPTCIYQSYKRDWSTSPVMCFQLNFLTFFMSYFLFFR